MSDSKILQALLDGQRMILHRIDELESKLTKRIDLVGEQVAYLEDDAPTREEFVGLEKRVSMVEDKMAK